jgi:photosystem II stability/assembly factor-like uncharacterized protein
MNIVHLIFLILTPYFFACNNVSEFSTADVDQVLKSNTTCIKTCNKKGPETTNIIFESQDGGVTWQDISAGLPESVQAEGFFASDTDVYMNIKGGLYHSRSGTKTPVWKKEIFLNQHNNAIAFGHNSVFSYSYDGHILQKINTGSMWIPAYTNFHQAQVRTIFESSNGNVFIGTDTGLFKSSDSGINWSHIMDEGWVMKIVESKGILIATGEKGIMRSTDDGENWNWVISEGGVGIAVENIDGGFAAISYNTVSKNRRIHLTYDGGKTWQAIEAGLPPSASIASIKQMGKYLLCGHPDGIFRSSDQGKTWSLVMPPSGKKVFNLYTTGTKIYAVPMNSGC